MGGRLTREAHLRTFLGEGSGDAAFYADSIKQVMAGRARSGAPIDDTDHSPARRCHSDRARERLCPWVAEWRFGYGRTLHGTSRRTG
jgi:hypothetical protein